MASHSPSIGDHLRSWRHRRRRSQLDLALDADVSARHLSFIETGRARPSREMVLSLAGSLDVPLREQNVMLLAAGYAPAFSALALCDDPMTAARVAVETILQAHEPFPAIAIDRHWMLVAGNSGAALLTEGAAPHLLAPPVNVLRVALHPDGMLPRIVNAEAWCAHILLRLQRDVFATADPVLADLLAELSGYVPASKAEHGRGDHIFLPLVLRGPDGGELAFVSTITNFGTPADVTLAELSLESFFPADERTRQALADRK